MRSKSFLPFEEAREYVRDFRFKDAKAFRSMNRPEFIPSSPNTFYKNDGWVSWGDWLDNGNLAYGRKYDVNHDFFKIWSDDMAYILGLWWADGCISKKGNGYRFNLSQHSKDKEILEKVLEVMESNHPIRKDKKWNCCSLDIDSQIIPNDLISLGGSPRKSKIATFPEVPQKHIRSFVRGYFDGDGSVFVSRNQLTVDIVSASEIFMISLRDKIAKLDETMNVLLRKRPSGDYWDVKCFSSNAVKFCDQIYSNSAKLKIKRKYNVYKDFVRRK